MATCKDCINYEKCGGSLTNNLVPCDFFKNKADVVEVVRCKDCKFSRQLNEQEQHTLKIIAVMVKGSAKMVSNKKYKKALEDCERYRRTLEAKQSKDWFALQDASRYQKENEELSKKVEEYKGKYLDELQKRLELAELINRMECEKQCQVDITI